MKSLPHCCRHTGQSPLVGITVLVQVTVAVADAVRWAAMKKAVTGTNINGMNL